MEKYGFIGCGNMGGALIAVAPEDGVTYVVGHINPDTDTVGTAIA